MKLAQPVPISVVIGIDRFVVFLQAALAIGRRLAITPSCCSRARAPLALPLPGPRCDRGSARYRTRRIHRIFGGQAVAAVADVRAYPFSRAVCRAAIASTFRRWPRTTVNWIRSRWSVLSRRNFVQCFRAKRAATNLAPDAARMATCEKVIVAHGDRPRSCL